MNAFWIIFAVCAVVTLIFANCLRSMRDRRGE